MTEPVCRVCWLATLTPDERQRVAQEAVVSCIYLCPDHQNAMDSILVQLAPIQFIRVGPQQWTAEQVVDFRPVTD